ncbi:hypothetical protein DFQ03_2948 [Maribacter caenipelagi]|uniref:Uncharacterized protein n=1 Tax=Maribacter caenipelagi TaxID=1447781 RepID=A0A4R7CYH5_9FLAO|nr:hypothetical protein DFQ03_2948 [Maribacter caenipelagi]
MKYGGSLVFSGLEDCELSLNCLNIFKREIKAQKNPKIHGIFLT